MQLQTLRIKHSDGYTIINRDDFDPSEHELFEEPESQVVESSTIQLPDDPAIQVASETLEETTPELKAGSRSLRAKKA